MTNSAKILRLAEAFVKASQLSRSEVVRRVNFWYGNNPQNPQTIADRIYEIYYPNVIRDNLMTTGIKGASDFFRGVTNKGETHLHNPNSIQFYNPVRKQIELPPNPAKTWGVQSLLFFGVKEAQHNVTRLAAHVDRVLQNAIRRYNLPQVVEVRPRDKQGPEPA